MPKGDRAILKADPEDGTTPLANLLLEAVSIAKLTGLEKGLILYLWRQTYGWAAGGERVKEAQILQGTITKFFTTSPKSIYLALKSLTEKHVVIRRDLGQGNGYAYRMNTRITEWNECIDLDALVALMEFIRLGINDRGSQIDLPLSNTPSPATLDEASPEAKKGGSHVILPLSFTPTLGSTQMTSPTLYKESLNKVNKDVVDPLQPSTPASKYYFEKANRKRWANKVQKEEFERCENEVGFDRMKNAIDWALTSGIHNPKSMITAARKKKELREKKVSYSQIKDKPIPGLTIEHSGPEGEESGTIEKTDQ